MLPITPRLHRLSRRSSKDFTAEGFTYSCSGSLDLCGATPRVGGSARGGLLFRAIQHADPNWRAENATLHLYKHLSQPGTRYRIYCLAKWPEIDGIASQDETYDEIRLVEMLWQIRLAIGAPRRMPPFFRDVQNNFDKEAPRATIYRGLNVDSALEKTRNYVGSANRSF
jgi:hypothetical protein